MGKLPNKFEDWTAPWVTRGEDFDEDKAARLIYNVEKRLETAKENASTLTEEKSELEVRVTQLEAKSSGKPDSDKDAEIAALRKQLADIEKDGRPQDRDAIARLRVAMDFGLEADDAERLRGKTPEELAEDAEKLAARLGIEIKSKDSTEGENEPAGSKPPERGVTPGQGFGNGRKRTGTPPALVTAEEALKLDSGVANNGLNLSFVGSR